MPLSAPVTPLDDIADATDAIAASISDDCDGPADGKILRFEKNVHDAIRRSMPCGRAIMDAFMATMVVLCLLAPLFLAGTLSFEEAKSKCLDLGIRLREIDPEGLSDIEGAAHKILPKHYFHSSALVASFVGVLIWLHFSPHRINDEGKSLDRTREWSFGRLVPSWLNALLFCFQCSMSHVQFLTTLSTHSLFVCVTISISRMRFHGPTSQQCRDNCVRFYKSVHRVKKRTRHTPASLHGVWVGFFFVRKEFTLPSIPPRESTSDDVNVSCTISPFTIKLYH
jgi:hypothetical protein